jgi:CheY-like chemotaxis protein
VTAKGRRVLVVDDFTVVADRLARLVQSLGHDVRAAYSGPSALVEVRRFRPDVVLLAVVLSGMDGCDVVRALRQEYPPGALTIVTLTGLLSEEVGRRCLRAGADFHVIKPIGPRALGALLAGAAQPVVPVRARAAEPPLRANTQKAEGSTPRVWAGQAGYLIRPSR